MLRLRSLSKVGKSILGIVHSQPQLAFIPGLQAVQEQNCLALCEQSYGIFRGFATAPTTTEDSDTIATDLEQATGLERQEAEAKAHGVDIFHEEWLDAPFGTETEPVQVTSYFSERIVGVPDPYDDSIIWWGTIKEGEPPRQLVTNGEYFILKRLHDDNHGHH